MSNFERDIGAKSGAQFSLGEDRKVRFAFVVDPATIIGPRLARESDQIEHPEAWAAFRQTFRVAPLDRDASGETGGSLPHEQGGRKRRARKVKNEPALDSSNGG